MKPATLPTGFVHCLLEFAFLHARGVVRVEKGFDHIKCRFWLPVNVHEPPVFFVGVTIVRNSATLRGHSACILHIRSPCFPPAVGKGENGGTGAPDRVGEQRRQQRLGGISLSPFVGALRVTQHRRRHVAVGTNFREVHGLVAALGKVHGSSVGYIPAVYIESPEVNIGECSEQLHLWHFAVGGGYWMVWVFRVDGINGN